MGGTSRSITRLGSGKRSVVTTFERQFFFLSLIPPQKKGQNSRSVFLVVRFDALDLVFFAGGDLFAELFCFDFWNFPSLVVGDLTGWQCEMKKNPQCLFFCFCFDFPVSMRFFFLKGKHVEKDVVLPVS